MRIEIKVPSVGESISQVEIGEWVKAQGDTVTQNETLLLLETDKATVELNAPESGTLVEVLKKPGDSAAIGEVIARLETATNGAAASVIQSEPARLDQKLNSETEAASKVHGASTAEEPSAAPEVSQSGSGDGFVSETAAPQEFAPRENDIEIIAAKEKTAQEAQDAEPVADLSSGAAPSRAPTDQARENIAARNVPAQDQDQIAPMSMLRRRIAERLVAAQQSAALLTTFNEIDMSAIIKIRQKQGEAFRERHAIKLGFMAFFIKAAITALQTVREANAEIRGNNIVYHRTYDIGVAVGGGKGLVVPVLRDADRMSFAQIERAIDDFARRARESKLRPDELQGGTFTITNGGVYGSLLSTPIVNPPQSAILGLHAIQERPVARNGRVAVRPMMYVALTYDHRIIDGREAVLFLKQVKSMTEQPARLLLEL
jgi:2-oxoglutarate dehydrogenase E2 component (dihydrolipoamide succinyltransferase)